jgi:hypothetical protein
MAEDIRAKLKIDGLDESAKGLDKVAGAAEDVTTALEDSESKGKQVAAQLKASAAQIEQALKDDAEAAEALGDALGPELTARMNVNSAVADLKKLGLTADEIKADAAALADAIKAIDDVRVDDSELRQLGETAETTAKKLDRVDGGGSNLRGNAIADLTGPLGAASSAASDFAGVFDGLSDTVGAAASKMGASSQTVGRLTSAIGGAGVVVAAGVAIWSAWRGSIDAAKAKAKELADAQKDINEALKEGNALAAANKLVETYPQAFKAAELLNVSLEDTVRFLTGQTDALAGVTTGTEEYSEKQAAAAWVVKSAQADWEKANGTLEDQKKWTDAAAEAMGVLGEEMKDGGDSAEDLGAGVDIGEAALKGLGDTAQDVEQFIKDLEDQWKSLSDEIDQDQSWLDLQTQFDNVKQSAIDAFVAAAEGSADAEQKARDYQTEVNSLKQDIITYGAEVLKLPPEQVTRILADIDNGSLDEAERLLDLLTQTRTAAVNVVLTGLNLGTQIANALAGLGRVAVSSAPPAAAALAPGVQATDLVLTPQATAGTSVVQVARTVPTVTSVTNIVHVPRGYREIDAANALYRNQRRSGRLYAKI